MMLYQILQKHDFRLPENVKVCSANTGKEHIATLDFVRDCAANWGVDIVWLEWHKADKPNERWRIVDYEMAARAGEPFEGLIEMRGYLPNPVTRFCTQELKIRPMKYYAQQVLGWQVAIGFRADEPRRVAKLRKNHDVFECIAPLVEMGVTKFDVAEFWRKQPFDLKLPNHNGVTDYGNCDLCFLKGNSKRASLIAEYPLLADWWIEQENKTGKVFRLNSPCYKQLKEMTMKQISLFADDDFMDCFCSN